ncbi:nucleotide sugar dehydrogenase [Candidatus Babeliales bacterium]|nr:nucleotide sugar dehydrogenase [Candidatus Babeliales bacterium]
MKVSVVGLGYIGLPTAIMLAEHGVQAYGYDVDREKVQRINKGHAVIKEDGLQERLQAVLGLGLFCADTTLHAADYFIIAVPTPFIADKKPDLSYVHAASKEIAGTLRPGNCVILESTVPVGATARLEDTLAHLTGFIPGDDFFVAHCPERVLPGKIFYELIYNDRIIGGMDEASTDAAVSLYNTFVKGELHKTDAATAELVKLIENSSRDVEIAFAHQVAAMAKKINRDPYQVIALANKHPRVNILKPSCGVGGHCIAVDPWFLIDTFKNETTLLRSARVINDKRPYDVLQEIKQHIQMHNEKQPRVLLLGLTYKPDVDDLRESPALKIALELQRDHEKTCKVSVCEPHVIPSILSRYFEADQCVTYKDGVLAADIVVALVGHSVFKTIETLNAASVITLDYCGITSRESEKRFAKKKKVMMSTSTNQIKEHAA